MSSEKRFLQKEQCLLLRVNYPFSRCLIYHARPNQCVWQGNNWNISLSNKQEIEHLLG
jgi:hypothetical protein